MPTDNTNNHSPLAILAELAVEGTSTLVEAQRALLDLARQENDIILTGLQGNLARFAPAGAMTDLVRRSVDTLIEMHEELLNTGSRQTLLWLQSQESNGATRFAEFARESVETFTRAQAKLLEALKQESARISSGNGEHNRAATKKEMTELAREAGQAFIEAQKRMLDLIGQQMNVNFALSSRALDMLPSPEVAPLANLATKGVRDFMAAEGALIESVFKSKKSPRPVHKKKRAPKPQPPKS